MIVVAVVAERFQAALEEQRTASLAAMGEGTTVAVEHSIPLQMKNAIKNSKKAAKERAKTKGRYVASKKPSNSPVQAEPEIQAPATN